MCRGDSAPDSALPGLAHRLCAAQSWCGELQGWGWWGKDPRAESWWDNLVVLPQAAVVSSHSPGTAACPCLVSVPQLPVPGACWGWVSPTATRTPVTCLSPAPRTSQLLCSYQKHLGAGDGSCCSGAGTQLVPLRLRGPAPACASWDFPPLL